MPGPYQWVTLTQAEADLVGRLYDPQEQFSGGAFYWTAAELSSYLQEALRTWNALTSIWRSGFSFPLSQGVYWYDITTAPNSPRPLTVTDNNITSQIEYHLLEPQTTSYPLSWTGSAQFSINDILGAIQRRRDETLSITGCEITQTNIVVPSGRVVLSDSTIDIRRVAWIPDTNLGFVPSPLFMADVQEKEYFEPGWTTSAQGVPNVWMASTEPPLSFDIDRIPPVPGDFDILTVNAGPALSTTSATVLGIPDDWSFVVKWGALADLLGREGQAQDALRAQYCEKRYREGLALLLGAPALLNLRVGGLAFETDAVTNGDQFNWGWQAVAQGPPQVAYIAGLNLIGFNAPDNRNYSATPTVVQNAPFTDSNNNLQVSREDYDVIIDYAQHLAMFKLGGKEFFETIPLYQRFLKQAAIYNSKIAQIGAYKMPIYEISQLEAERNPVIDPKVMGD